MIKANELRLGNWVSCEGKPYQVNINILQSFTVSPVWMDPIQLTPEILEMCGFEKDDEGFWLHDKGRVALQLEQQDYTDDSFDYHCGIRFDIGMPFNDLLIGVQHLHQLQNLYFALTGTELEIKSPL